MDDDSQELAPLRHSAMTVHAKGNGMGAAETRPKTPARVDFPWGLTFWAEIFHLLSRSSLIWLPRFLWSTADIAGTAKGLLPDHFSPLFLGVKNRPLFLVVPNS